MVTLAAACLAASLQAQAPYTSDPSSRLDAWLAAALSHTPGELDGPVNVVAPWSQAELTELLGGLQKQFKAFLAGRRPWSSRRSSAGTASWISPR